MVPTSTYARLPAPPFDFHISPARVSQGDSVTIQIAPATRSSATTERLDIYVLWAYAEEAAFLTREGAWAPAPVALSRDTTLKDPPPLSVTWNGARPVMDIPLALLVVPTGTDPLDRAQWAYRPVVRWLSVRGPSTPWSVTPGALVFGLVAAASSLVIALADIRGVVRRGEGA